MVKFFSKYFLYIIFFFYFLVNIDLLDNLPFGFDYDYYQGELDYIKNPLYTWLPWSKYYKSWPLTYSVLWLFKAIFGKSVVLLRFFNLVLHFCNFILLRKILKLENTKPKYINLITLLFLFNPLSILTFIWTFQVKTLLAMTLFLLLIVQTLKTHYQKIDLFKIFSLFWLSLNAKVLGILFPFFFTFYNRKKLKTPKIYLSTLILFSIAAIYGLLNIKGVTYLVKELNYMAKNSFENTIDEDYTTSEVIDLKGNVSTKSEREINLIKEISRGGNEYLNSLGSLSSVISKHIVAIQNFGRLILSSLGINDYYPFYESNAKTIKGNKIYLFSFIAIAMLCIFIYKKSYWSLMAFILFIPISGYFYVPYMKFSYSSDHWFYPAMPFVLLSLFQITKKPLIWTIIALTISSSYFYTIYRYQSFPKALTENYRVHRNKVVLESLLYYKQLRGAKNEMLTISQYLFDYEVYYKNSYYDALYISSIGANKLDILKKYFPRKVSYILRNKNELKLAELILKHELIIPTRIKDLINALTAVNKNAIDNELYIKTIKHLDDTKDQP